jgi:tRNA (guanine-N7-)-methyltransferase
MWQNFFQSEKKFLNPYINKLLENKDYVMYEKTDIDSKKGKWQEHFGNENPVYLEIGSGAGNFTVRNSEKYRDKNYIGVELRFKRLILSANKARKRDLKNILFLRRNGVDLLNFIGENEIDGMYINFPDPWEKKVKNRIISKELFDKLEIIMKNGAKLYFKTDHYEYYCDVLEKMKDIKGFKIVYNTENLYESEKAEDNISTEFEDLFLKQGLKINYIEIEKEV